VEIIPPQTQTALLGQILYLARSLLLAAVLVQPSQTQAALAVLAAAAVKIKQVALAILLWLAPRKVIMAVLGRVVLLLLAAVGVGLLPLEPMPLQQQAATAAMGLLLFYQVHQLTMLVVAVVAAIQAAPLAQEALAAVAMAALMPPHLTAPLIQVVAVVAVVTLAAQSVLQAAPAAPALSF